MLSLNQHRLGEKEVFPEPTLSEQDRVMTKGQIPFLPDPEPPHLLENSRAVMPTSSTMRFPSEPQNYYQTDCSSRISLLFCTHKRCSSEEQSDLAKNTVRGTGLRPHQASTATSDVLFCPYPWGGTLASCPVLSRCT